MNCHLWLLVTPEARQAFAQLMEKFVFTPILRMPNLEKPYTIKVDASEVGLHSFTSTIKICTHANFSHKLTEAERNYNIMNCELLTVKATLEE